MTEFLVVMHFSLRGLWVEGVLLGRSFEFRRAGRAVRLLLPKGKDDFGFGPPNPPRYWPVGAPLIGPSEDLAKAITIYALRVEVEAAAEITRADFEGPPDRPGFERAAREANKLWTEAYEIAERLVRDFIAWVRVLGRQPWLGLGAEVPVLQGHGDIIERDTGTRLPFSGGRSISVMMPSFKSALKPVDLEQLAGKVQSADVPSIAEGLLADAQFLAWHAEVQDRQRAVLSAATACEVKVTETLRQKVNPSKRELLGYVLKSQRRLLPLFHEVLKASLAISLADTNRTLYDRLDRLIKARNEVVHHGAPVTEAEAREHIETAQLIFAWIDSL